LTLLIYESLAKVFAQQKNFDQAISYWSKLVKVKPDEPDVLNDLGIVFFHQGKLDKAVESWSKSLRLNPDQAKVHNWLANVSASRGSIAETVAHWQQSLKIDSNQPNLHNKLATVFYQKKQFDDAFTHWTSALSMEPDHPGILNSLAWMKATNEGSNFYDPQEAVELAQLACELTEYKQPSILDTLSVAYAAAGRFDEAIKTARKAVSLATSANQPQLAEEIESHLRLFEAGRPYLENATIAK
jgi:tetratricopeptide (TPR) repeat protein